METTYEAAAAPKAAHKNGFLTISRKMLGEHRHGILRTTLAYLGLWLAIGILWGIVGMTNTRSIMLFYFLIGSIGAVAFASMMFADMKTKEGRLSVLMMPATAAAKFWPRVLAGFLGTAVIMVIGIFCEELGRLLGSLIMMRYEVFEFISLESVPYDFTDDGYEILLFTAYGVLQLSIYFFGAILWPKTSFIKTTGVLVCVSLMISIVGGLIISGILHHGYRFELLVSDHALFGIMVATMLAVSALLIWLAYRRFKNSTLMYGLRQK